MVAFLLLVILLLQLKDAVISTSTSSLSLSDVVRQGAGLYVDPSNMGRKHSHHYQNLNKTVLVTAINHGYLNFLHNFKCFLDMLSMKAVVLSLDQKAHEYVHEHLINFYSYYLTIGNETVHESATEFRSKQFHLITNRKIEGVLRILKLGYDAIFIDPDIALLRDPTPYLFWQGIDYVHSVNKICPGSDAWDFYQTEEEGNTGLYFIKSNARTIQLLENFIITYPKHPELDDQTILWTMLRSMKSPQIDPKPKCSHIVGDSSHPETLVTCHLDGCLFSAGGLRGAAYNWLEAAVKKRNESVVSIHANFVKGMCY